MVHSTCMRNCFLLASTDGTADVAYALASYYENFTFNPEVQDAERTLMADLNFRRRRLGAPEAASSTADAPLRLGGRIEREEPEMTASHMQPTNGAVARCASQRAT